MISFLPVLSIMGTIFILSHTEGQQLPTSLDGFDKILHIIAYTALGLSALFAVRKKYLQKPLKISILVILFCFLYGISDEYHQSFIVGRYPSGLDLVADVTGGVIAVLGWMIWVKRYRTVKTNKKKRPSKQMESRF